MSDRIGEKVHLVSLVSKEQEDSAVLKFPKATQILSRTKIEILNIKCWLPGDEEDGREELIERRAGRVMGDLVSPINH